MAGRLSATRQGPVPLDSARGDDVPRMIDSPLRMTIAAAPVVGLEPDSSRHNGWLGLPCTVRFGEPAGMAGVA
jgi:hypothetical protein